MTPEYAVHLLQSMERLSDEEVRDICELIGGGGGSGLRRKLMHCRST